MSESLSRSRSSYLKFKESHGDKLNEKMICECGGKYSYFNKSTHMITTKHKQFMKLKEEIKDIKDNKTELISQLSKELVTINFQLDVYQNMRKVIEEKLKYVEST